MKTITGGGEEGRKAKWKSSVRRERNGKRPKKEVNRIGGGGRKRRVKTVLLEPAYSIFSSLLKTGKKIRYRTIALPK